MGVLWRNSSRESGTLAQTESHSCGKSLIGAENLQFCAIALSSRRGVSQLEQLLNLILPSAYHLGKVHHFTFPLLRLEIGVFRTSSEMPQVKISPMTS